jgi:hypothetical protein
MWTVAIKLKLRREVGFDALFETGKRNPLSRGIKAVRASWEMTIRNIRPPVAVIASFNQRIMSNGFIPGVVRNESHSAILAGIFVVWQFIILGVEQMKQCLGMMKFENLLMKRDNLFSFFGIACNGDAGDGEFKPPLGFNRSANNGVIAEDLFDFIGIGRFAANANAGGLVVG